MKYTKKERLNIGRRVYDGELTRYEAAEEYKIDPNTVRGYMRLYRDSNNLPAKNATHPAGAATVIERTTKPEYDEFADMTKEELIRELIKSRINEARLKKGYEVK